MNDLVNLYSSAWHAACTADWRIASSIRRIFMYSRNNQNSSVNFKSYLVIRHLTMIKTNCYKLCFIHKGLLMIGLSFVKNVSTNCTLIPTLPGNFLRSKILIGSFLNIAFIAQTQIIIYKYTYIYCSLNWKLKWFDITSKRS